MNKFTYLTIIALIFAVGLAAACSSDSKTTTTNVNQATTNTSAANNTTTAKTEDETPASVKAAFPDANSFTKQHKDIPKDAIADIEKDTGAKVSDTDHHSYLAFSTDGGARKQIGAATIVKADGKDFVVVYENKDGNPVIKEVRGGDGLPSPFLAQFAGKGHDDKFQIGADLKANGVDEAAAKAVAQAIQVDSITMQTLYGSAHSH